MPAPGQTEPVLPAVVDGVLDYGSIDMDLLRTYTVRRHDADAGEVTIEFVLHDHGVVTAWARAAGPGAVVGLNLPTGMYDAPTDLAWQVLVADCAALPALSRVLEQTPPDVRNRVVVEVPGDEHRIDLPAHPRTEVTWVHGGNGHRPSRLEDVVRALPHPDAPVATSGSPESRARCAAFAATCAAIWVCPPRATRPWATGSSGPRSGTNATTPWTRTPVVRSRRCGATAPRRTSRTTTTSGWPPWGGERPTSAAIG